MTLNFDTDGDRRISVSEAARITELIFRNTPVTSLAGIEYCTALMYLDCSDNQLTTLDVSNCKQLKVLDLNPMPSLQTLYMKRGQTIETMDIPKTTQIKNRTK